MADDERRTKQDELGHRALQSIRRIIRRVSSHSRHMSKETGLTVPQLLCMRAIRDEEVEEVTVAAVAEAVHLSRSTVSGVVDRLVRAGLVNRDRSQRDRRRVHLTLTEVGSARLAEMPTPLQDRFLGRLADMEEADQERLLSALEQVVELMDAEDIDAAPMLVPGVDVPTGR